MTEQKQEEWMCLICGKPQYTFENMIVHIYNEHLDILKSMPSVFDSLIKQARKMVNQFNEQVQAALSDLAEQYRLPLLPTHKKR